MGSSKKILPKTNVDTGPTEPTIADLEDPILFIPCESKNTGITVDIIAIKKDSKYIRNDLLKKIELEYENREISMEIAAGFINDVEKRALGNGLSTPILETLLFFQFEEKPELEFMQGFTQTFKTKGHPKAKGSDWQIKVPISWKVIEADRPNIIKKFISDYGSGEESIMIMTQDLELPKDYKVSKEEINELFSEKEVIKMTPKGAKFISFNKVTIDNYSGGVMEVELKQTNEDDKSVISIRMVQYMFIANGKMYLLQGTVNDDKDLASKMKKFTPLFKMVAKSIVENEQYK